MTHYQSSSVRTLRSSNGYNTTNLLPNMEVWVVNDMVMNWTGGCGTGM